MTGPVPYSGRFAELYDALYADKDYAAEASFVSARVTAVGAAPRVLDVACGTGRHAEELARLGVDVAGVDASADMIALARRRLPSAPLRVGDMTRLDERGVFDAAVCLFDSLGYARTDAGVSSTLRGMAGAVRAGGLVVVEVWHAAAMFAHFEPVRLRRLPGGVIRFSETSVDARTAVATVRWTLCAPGAPPLEETHQGRMFLAPELARFIEDAGLELSSLTGGFSDEPPSLDTFHLVAVARKRAS